MTAGRKGKRSAAPPQISKGRTVEEKLSLRDATVQEIQHELVRRTRFNAFDGERICASLQAHRELWTAVLLDRPGVPNYAGRQRSHLSLIGVNTHI